MPARRIVNGTSPTHVLPSTTSGRTPRGISGATTAGSTRQWRNVRSTQSWLMICRPVSGGPTGSSDCSSGAVMTGARVEAEPARHRPGGAPARDHRALDRGGVTVVAGDEQAVAEVHRPADLQRRRLLRLRLAHQVGGDQLPARGRGAVQLDQLAAHVALVRCGRAGVAGQQHGRLDEVPAGRRVGRGDVGHHRAVDQRAAGGARGQEQQRQGRRCLRRWRTTRSPAPSSAAPGCRPGVRP